MSLDFFLICIPNPPNTNYGVVSEKVFQNQVPGSKSSLVRITYYFIFVTINCIEFTYLCIESTYPCTESTYISSESHESIPVAFPLSSLADACLSQVSQNNLYYLLKISDSHITSISDNLELSRHLRMCTAYPETFS